MRERDERLANEIESLKGRLADVTAELERTSARFRDEARLKILLQADIAQKREQVTELSDKVRALEDELAEMREAGTSHPFTRPNQPALTRLFYP